MISNNKWHEQIYQAANGTLFQSHYTNGVQKIHFSTDNTSWRQLATSLPDHLEEFSPVAEFKNGIWRISFLAGNLQQIDNCNLYRLLAESAPPTHDADILNISAVSQARAGCVSEFVLAYAQQPTGPVLITRGNASELNLTFTDAATYKYISYNPESPDELLICGTLIDGKEFLRGFELTNNIAYQYSPEIFSPKSTREILPAELFKISSGLRCRYAHDTSRKAFVNIPCRGNAIICQRDGHLTYARNCTQLNCRHFLI